MTKLKIKVTKDILERSKMCDSGQFPKFDQKEDVGANCAIAMAIRDIFPIAFVSSYGIYPFYYRGLSANTDYQIPLPIEATFFIKEFDSKRPKDRLLMREIEFEVEISDDVIEQIDIEEVRDILLNHPVLELV